MQLGLLMQILYYSFPRVYHNWEVQAQTRSVGVWNEVLVAGKERGIVLSIVHCIHFLPPSSGLL